MSQTASQDQQSWVLQNFFNWVETDVSWNSNGIYIFPSALCNSLWRHTDCSEADGRCVASVRPDKVSSKGLQAWPDEHPPKLQLVITEEVDGLRVKIKPNQAVCQSRKVVRCDCFLFVEAERKTLACHLIRSQHRGRLYTADLSNSATDGSEAWAILTFLIAEHLSYNKTRS